VLGWLWLAWGKVVQKTKPMELTMTSPTVAPLSESLEGVKTCNKTLIHNLTPSLSTGPLTHRTMEALMEFFSSADHRPSQDMLIALTRAASVLEAMADGECTPKVYLSSLDPGVGKTQTIIHFIRALLASQNSDHADVGVILCVSRLQEITGLVAALGLQKEGLSVLTSDETLNALGVSPGEGRILITTHKMVESRVARRAFSEVSEFHWRGHPRLVRIWDEAILPGRPITVSRDDIASLFKPIRSRYPKLAEDLEGLFMHLKEAKDQSILNLPDFAEVNGLDLNEVLEAVQGYPQQHLQALENLWFLSGRTVTVRKDGPRVQTLLDYRNTLPDDIGPLLVMDASGRVRTVYKLWETHRGGLVWLASATKRYDNLKVHLWQTGGGKRTFRQKGQELIEGVATTINSKPGQDWLVIHHQKGINMDFEVEVRGLMSSRMGEVHFLGWGSHDATNQFAQVPNVILAGTLFYPVSFYESLGRLAADYRSEQGVFPDDELDQVQLGEHCHLILQALCRGSVRRCQGDVCAPCNAYIIASARSGIPRVLPEMFPGAKLYRWHPVKRSLKGKVAEAIEYIEQWIKENAGEVLRFHQVYKAIGMAKSNFRRSVRQHPDFQEALAERGIVEMDQGVIRFSDLFPEDPPSPWDF
jgi:hypothetical protein